MWGKGKNKAGTHYGTCSISPANHESCPGWEVRGSCGTVPSSALAPLDIDLYLDKSQISFILLMSKSREKRHTKANTPQF